MKKIIYALLGLNIIYFIIYLFQIPVFHQLRYWFWDFQYKDLQHWYWLLLDFSLIMLLLYFVLKDKIKYRFLLLILIYAAGVFHQFSIGFSEGKGINGMSERMLREGHSEFIRVSAEYPNLSYLITNYNDLADGNRLGLFPKSKPPGTLAFYIVLGNITDIFYESNSTAEKVKNTAEFSAIILPFISALVIFPMFYFAAGFLNNKFSAAAGMLFISSPAFSLIILAMDNALYPLLFAVILLINDKNSTNPIHWKSFLLGSFIYISLFFAFSLLPIILISLGIFTCFIMKNTLEKRYQISLLYLSNVFMIFGGIILMHLAFELLLNYNFIDRYQQAIQFHWQWKHWVNTPKYILYFAGINYLDFGMGLGLSAISIYFLSVINTSFTLIQKTFSKLKVKFSVSNYITNLSKYEMYSLLTILTFIFLGLLGKTKSETARLWLFLMPLVCILIIKYLDLKFQEKAKPLILLLIALQLLTDYLLKFSQDFEYLN